MEEAAFAFAHIAIEPIRGDPELSSAIAEDATQLSHLRTA
jgi:hypothetical protein